MQQQFQEQLALFVFILNCKIKIFPKFKDLSLDFEIFPKKLNAQRGFLILKMDIVRGELWVKYPNETHVKQCELRFGDQVDRGFHGIVLKIMPDNVTNFSEIFGDDKFQVDRILFGKAEGVMCLDISNPKICLPLFKPFSGQIETYSKFIEYAKNFVKNCEPEDFSGMFLFIMNELNNKNPK